MDENNELPATEPQAEDAQHAGRIRKGRRRQHDQEDHAPDVFDEQIVAQQASQAEKDRRADQVTQAGDRSARRHENLYAIIVDREAGVRLEREEKRVPGQTAPRLLVSFDADKLPSKDETSLLRKEGFSYDGEIKAWTMANNPQNQVLAKHAVNGLLEMRGIGPKIAVAAR